MERGRNGVFISQHIDHITYLCRSNAIDWWKVETDEGFPQKVDDEVLNLYILRERDQAKINPRDK